MMRYRINHQSQRCGIAGLRAAVVCRPLRLPCRVRIVGLAMPGCICSQNQRSCLAASAAIRQSGSPIMLMDIREKVKKDQREGVRLLLFSFVSAIHVSTEEVKMLTEPGQKPAPFLGEPVPSITPIGTDQETNDRNCLKLRVPELQILRNWPGRPHPGRRPLPWQAGLGCGRQVCKNRGYRA